MAIELAKDFLIEQLLCIKGVFRPESADVLLRNRSAPSKFTHHAPVLLPVGIRLALCLTREQSDCRIDFVFEVIVKVAILLDLNRGEGWCLQHSLVETLIKDIVLSGILRESHLQGIILARCVLV